MGYREKGRLDNIVERAGAFNMMNERAIQYLLYSIGVVVPNSCVRINKIGLIKILNTKSKIDECI